MAVASRPLVRTLGAVAAAIVLIAMHGCGETASGDCTDKATCIADGGSAGDDAQARTHDATGEAQPGDDGSPDSPVLADGQIDADACAPGYTCIDLTPPGWQGPMALYEATGTQPPLQQLQPCAGAFPGPGVDGYADPIGPAGTCVCTYGPATGGQCDPSARATFFSDSMCQTRCDTPQRLDCQRVTQCNGPTWVEAPDPALTGESCASMPPSGPPLASWTRVGRVCAYGGGPSDGGTCTSGAHCVAIPSPPYDSHLCISTPGNVTCPGRYSKSHTYYASWMDTRDCGACPAGTPTGGSCGGTIRAFASLNCGSPLGAGVPLPATCAQLVLGANFSSSQATLTMSHGNCAPQAAAPTGNFALMGRTTVCCTQ